MNLYPIFYKKIGVTVVKKFRFLSMMLAAIITLTGFVNVGAFAAETKQSFETSSNNEVFLTEDDVFEALAYTYNDKALQDKIKSEVEYSPSGARIKSFDSEDYLKHTNNEYAGMYLNDDGILVICYVEDSQVLKSQKAINSKQFNAKRTDALVNEKNEVVVNDYMFKTVEYSEMELLSAYELVNEIAERGCGIETASIDVFSNRIVIGINDIEKMESINHNLSDITGMYAFEILDDNNEILDVATINGTSAINNGSISSTPAGKVYSTALKNWGIVTCGHGWTKGNSVYSGNTKIGTIIDRYYDGKNDSSLISLNSGHKYQDVKHDEFDSSVPVVGSTLTLRGFVSGRIPGAKILSNNASANTSGTYFTGMIQCDKPLQPGDSGGGAIGKYIDGGRTAVILAINKSTNATNSWLIKGKVICDAY